MTPVTIRDGVVDVAAIHAAIRARIEERRRGSLPAGPAAVSEVLESRLQPLDDWDFPRALWHAMYPPHLTPWNLNEDYPIHSHRPMLGPLLVAWKRLLRKLAWPLLNPTLVRQVEINRTLALLSWTFARELAQARVEIAGLEARLARLSGSLREERAETAPLVLFEDAGA